MGPVQYIQIRSAMTTFPRLLFSFSLPCTNYIYSPLFIECSYILVYSTSLLPDIRFLYFKEKKNYSAKKFIDYQTNC